MFFRSRSVQVCAPLIRGDQAHEYFFRVSISKGNRTCRYHSNQRGQDDDLSPLQDYGYYAAGIEAKKSYLRLMRYWRRHAGWRRWLSAAPRTWHIEITGKLTDTVSFDCRSSQLALLLGMIASQQDMPVTHIFATGELNNSADMPVVEPVAALKEKLDAILAHIAREQPLQPILIALPRKIHPHLPDGADNDSEVRFARRINTFLQQYQTLSIHIIYCNNLLEDLQLHFPRISRYQHYSKALKWSPVAALAALGYWQFQQPLYLNWDNQTPNNQPELQHPLRAQLLPNHSLKIQPLCFTSRPGEDVFAIGDLILIDMRVDDYSWLRGWTTPQTALVMVGEHSDIRVENFPVGKHKDKTDAHHYSIAFALEPPREKYLLMGIAQRSIAINKGTLNQKLIELTNGVQGIERLTIVAGYLEQEFSSVQYRFRLAPFNCGAS